MEQFIENIRGYPCLWKTDAEEYKWPQMKEAAWRNVVKISNLPNVKEAKGLWKKLRDGHRQALNNKKSSAGQPLGSEKPWKYEKLMEFLIPYMVNRRNSTPFLITNDTQQSISENDGAESDDENLQEPEMRGMKRKNIGDDSENEQMKSQSKIAQSDSYQEEILMRVQPNLYERTSTKSFFHSMSEMCDSLPETLQIKVERAIFNIVMEAREEKLKRRRDIPSTSGASIHRLNGNVPHCLVREKRPTPASPVPRLETLRAASNIQAYSPDRILPVSASQDYEVSNETLNTPNDISSYSFNQIKYENCE